MCAGGRGSWSCYNVSLLFLRRLLPQKQAANARVPAAGCGVRPPRATAGTISRAPPIALPCVFWGACVRACVQSALPDQRSAGLCFDVFLYPSWRAGPLFSPSSEADAQWTKNNEPKFTVSDLDWQGFFFNTTLMFLLLLSLRILPFLFFLLFYFKARKKTMLSQVKTFKISPTQFFLCEIYHLLHLFSGLA